MNNNVLICTSANIGDFVMATSAISLLKKTNPALKITVILSKSAKPLALDNPYIDNVIVYNFNISGFFIRRIRQTVWLFMNYLKIKNKFKTVFFFDYSPFLAYVSNLVKIPERIGPATFWTGFNMPNPDIKNFTAAIELHPDSDRIHMSERYQTIIRSYVPVSNIEIPRIPDTTKYYDSIKNFFNNDSSKIISLCLQGSKGSQNIWPLKYFKQVADEISKKFNSSFYILGSHSDASYADELINDFKLNAVNLCGKLSLLQSAEFLRNSDLLISVDTGLTHIAATLNTKQIVLYGKTLPDNSGAMSHKAVYIKANRPCSPCNYSIAFENNKCQLSCLDTISPEKVADKAIKILSGEKI